MRAISSLLIIGATAALWHSSALANEVCSDQRFIDELSAVKSWTSMYAFYKRNLPKCSDDGFYAEGYSKSVTELLVKNWSDFLTLSALTSQDADFRTFVLKHIDSTADPEHLGQIVASAQARCPLDSKPLCSAIARGAGAALAAQ